MNLKTFTHEHPQFLFNQPVFLELLSPTLDVSSVHYGHLSSPILIARAITNDIKRATVSWCHRFHWIVQFQDDCRSRNVMKIGLKRLLRASFRLPVQRQWSYVIHNVTADSAVFSGHRVNTTVDVIDQSWLSELPMKLTLACRWVIHKPGDYFQRVL